MAAASCVVNHTTLSSSLRDLSWVAQVVSDAAGRGCLLRGRLVPSSGASACFSMRSAWGCLAACRQALSPCLVTDRRVSAVTSATALLCERVSCSPLRKGQLETTHANAYRVLLEKGSVESTHKLSLRKGQLNRHTRYRPATTGTARNTATQRSRHVKKVSPVQRRTGTRQTVV